MIDGAAAAGDAAAAFVRATWFLTGEHGVRDLAQACALFGRAAAGGHGPAVPVLEAFLATGTGGPRDWPGALAVLAQRAGHDAQAATQAALLDAMPLTPGGDPVARPAARILSQDPRVILFPALFTPAECGGLAELAAADFQPSTVIDPRSGRPMRDPVRTSDVAAFPLAAEGAFVHALNRRIATATGTDPRQGEPLQVLRYAGGQQYHPHLDVLPQEANQRVLTVLVWLNDGYAGGETRFPELDLSLKGRPGDALAFVNVHATGRPDQRLRHAGLPVTDGAKLLASRWIRARPLLAG